MNLIPELEIVATKLTIRSFLDNEEDWERNSHSSLRYFLDITIEDERSGDTTTLKIRNWSCNCPIEIVDARDPRSMALASSWLRTVEISAHTKSCNTTPE